MNRWMLLLAALFLASCRSSPVAPDPPATALTRTLESDPLLRRLLDPAQRDRMQRLPDLSAYVIGRGLWIFARRPVGLPASHIIAGALDTDQNINTGYIPGRAGVERYVYGNPAQNHRLEVLDPFDEGERTGYAHYFENPRWLVIRIPLSTIDDDGIVNGGIGAEYGGVSFGGEFTSQRLMPGQPVPEPIAAAIN